jgi:pimeloyl-ACP methyl ester carboxylesterase
MADSYTQFVWGHGLTSSMAVEDAAGVFDVWRDLGDGCHVVRYDARGHGTADGPDDPAAYRWPQLARDRLALMDELGIDRAVLAGASMGAASALWATVLAPERVRALVLVIPPTAWSTRPAQSRQYRLGATILSAPLGDRAFLAAARVGPKPAILRDELAPLADHLVDGMAAIPRTRLAAILRGAADSDLPAPDELADAVGDRPVLVLAWDTDAGHPVSTTEALAAALAHAEVHVATEPADVLRWPQHVATFVAALSP